MVFRCNGANPREIGRGRDQVIGEIAGEQLAVSVIRKVLQKGAAEALDRAADCLSMQGQWIDDAADILDDETVEQLDMACSRIDRYMRRCRPVSVGQPVVVPECGIDS